MMPWTYMGDTTGISMSRPVGWALRPEEDSGTFGATFSTVEGFDVESKRDGASLTVVGLPLARYGLTDDVDELWNALAKSMSSGADVGKTESRDIGGANGLIAITKGTTSDFRGLLAMAIANDTALIFAAFASPSSTWGDYEPILMAMLDSVQFFLPAESPVERGRDDIPIPPNADVSVNVSEMVTYQVEGSMEDAIEFIEDNWPDKGWAADTDSVLHDPAKGLLIYAKDDETARIAVSEGEGNDAGKTTIVVIFSQAE
jgi:hypothetical protein